MAGGAILGGIFYATNSGDGADEGAGDVGVSDKVRGQLGERGWTEQEVRDAANGPAAGTSTDNTEGRNDPATVYGAADGYVVVNDRTREVVQVSDRTPGSGWIPDSRITWGE